MYRHRDLTIREHCLKCLTPIFTLATTGLPDIKRRNPRIRAIHLRNTQISAKCVTYLCQAGNHVHTLSLSTEDKRARFLKTPASLQFSDLHVNINHNS